MKAFSAAVAVVSIVAVSGCGNDPPAPRNGQNNAIVSEQSGVDANAPAGTVIFRGGYETNPVDRGRPVALIAAALGVETEVFRQAFSGVTPAHGRGPSEAEAQVNKKVLLDALGKPRTLIRHVEDRAGHDFRYAIDTTRVEHELGWKPQIDFETGLRSTIDWYLSNKGWAERIQSGQYLDYYKTQYGKRLA